MRYGGWSTQSSAMVTKLASLNERSNNIPWLSLSRSWLRVLSSPFFSECYPLPFRYDHFPRCTSFNVFHFHVIALHLVNSKSTFHRSETKACGRFLIHCSSDPTLRGNEALQLYSNRKKQQVSNSPSDRWEYKFFCLNGQPKSLIQAQYSHLYTNYKGRKKRMLE